MARSTRVRPGLVWVAAVLVVVVALFTVSVLGLRWFAFLDVSWRAWVIAHRTGWLTEVMVNVSRFGSTPSLVVMVLGAAGWLYWRGPRRDAVFVSLTSAAGLLISPVLKDLFDRARPALAEHIVVVQSSSYPSGHALNSMVVLGVLTVLAARGRPFVIAVGAVLVAAVGFSRVYLGVHYPSDIVAGWLIGAAWITACFAVRGNSGPSGTVEAGS